MDLGFNIWHRAMRIRMYGINAPELDTEAGKKAKVFLNSLLPLGCNVELVSFKDRADKFGNRWLGTIICGGKDVNQEMVALGFARTWDGRGQKPV